VRAVAVDWSGRARGEQEFIWVAVARGGRLVDLRNGFTRAEAVDRLIELGREEPRTAVGLDFAFSFPAWWCEERGWRGAEDVWTAMEADGDRILGACERPFWGPRGTSRLATRQRSHRRTDRGTAKSVFQLAGHGAVGTGSVRGMPHLLRLSREGFSVWPFEPPRLPVVVEIYPRALIRGTVRKSRWAERHAYLLDRFAGQDERLLERAAGSEDAFDAAVSALVMSRYEDELASLEPARDELDAIEGRIWEPRGQRE
jgi:hypothetical protein